MLPVQTCPVHHVHTHVHVHIVQVTTHANCLAPVVFVLVFVIIIVGVIIVCLIIQRRCCLGGQGVIRLLGSGWAGELMVLGSRIIIRSIDDWADVGAGLLVTLLRSEFPIAILEGKRGTLWFVEGRYGAPVGSAYAYGFEKLLVLFRSPVTEVDAWVQNLPPMRTALLSCLQILLFGQ